MIEGFRKEMNFRDIGGYQSADGRKIKKGLLYRSAALGLLIPEELDRVRELGIQTILDFRGSQQCSELPDPIFEECEQIHICAAYEDFREDLNDSPLEFYEMLVDEDQHGNMTATIVSSIQASLVFSNEAYKTMFRKLMEKKGPILIHCSVGKDRTGIGALLIMLALGIDDEQIRYDFLLSNTYLKEKVEERMNSLGFLPDLSENINTAVMAVEGVIPESVHMILAEILERYETYENFLLHEYDLTEEDLQKLRDFYLE